MDQQQQTWWIEYGDDIEIEVPRPAGPRHAAPSGPRHAAPRKPRRHPLVRRLARWALIYAVLYTVAAVVMALHPPTFELHFPSEPTTSATVTPAAHE